MIRCIGADFIADRTAELSDVIRPIIGGIYDAPRDFEVAVSRPHPSPESYFENLADTPTET